MQKASEIASVAESARRQAVIYARVSSKEQEKEGFSVPAQLKLLKEYAAANGFAVVQEYVDVETAKQTGRTAFSEMIAYLNVQAVNILLDRGWGKPPQAHTGEDGKNISVTIRQIVERGDED